MFKREREPFPMTDEEVIREALKTVTDYANRHPGDQFNINNCIDHALASVKDICKKARHYSSYQALKWEDQDEITRLIRRIATDLRARAYIKATECLKNRKIQQINMATAESLITYELRQRGFMFSFIWQKLRVKVSIKLECGSAMTFIVKYKDIREGKLLQILDEVMAVVEPLNKTKTNISVWPYPGPGRHGTDGKHRFQGDYGRGRNKDQ